ncbi:MAG: hypothetical protein ACTSQY_11080 [Candidatus Odinarchaeia archaeon]
MLKLSRREEDFSDLSLFHKFYDETEMGKLFSKYNIVDRDDLRELCLNEFSGSPKNGDKYKRLTKEEAQLVLYAIELDAITLQEYLETYDGDLDLFNHRFFSELLIPEHQRDKYLQQFLKENGIDVSTEELNDVDIEHRLPEDVLQILRREQVPLTREGIANFCVDLIYDEEPDNYVYYNYSDISVGEFIVLCVESNIISPYDLLPAEPFDSIYYMKFFSDIDYFSTIGKKLDDIERKMGIYDIFFRNIDEIMDKIIKDADVDSFLTLDELDIIRDMSYDYRKDWYAKMFAHYVSDPSEEKIKMLEILRKYLYQSDIHYIETKITGPYVFEEEEMEEDEEL